MSTAIEIPKVEEVESEASAIVAKANAITVASQDDKVNAVGFLRDIKTMAQRVEVTLGPSRDAAHRAHKAVLDAIGKLLNPLNAAEKNIKSKVSCWDMEQERIRREAQRKADEEARKVAEEKRLQEAMRLEAEQRVREAEAERLRKAGQAEAAEKARLEAEAKAAQVQAALDRPIVVAPVVLPKAEKVDGAASRTRWRAEVVDKSALIRAVADGLASEEMLIENMTSLNAMARAMRKTMNIPGVVAVEESELAVRSWR